MDPDCGCARCDSSRERRLQVCLHTEAHEHSPTIERRGKVLRPARRSVFLNANSVAPRQRRGPVAECPLIALTEAVAIIFKRRRRYGWVAESWMAISIRRHSLRDVVPCCIESVMKAALRDLSECGWRWRRSIHNRPRMRTTGNGERQCQYNKC